MTLSKPCLPLMVRLVPLGALSLTSRVAAARRISRIRAESGGARRALAGVVEVLIEELEGIRRVV